MSSLSPPANVLPLPLRLPLPLPLRPCPRPRPRDDDENTRDLVERKREDREHHQSRTQRRPAVSYQFLWEALGIAR